MTFESEVSIEVAAGEHAIRSITIQNQRYLRWKTSHSHACPACQKMQPTSLFHMGAGRDHDYIIAVCHRCHGKWQLKLTRNLHD